jgi:hypothetical protein
MQGVEGSSPSSSTTSIGQVMVVPRMEAPFVLTSGGFVLPMSR